MTALRKILVVDDDPVVGTSFDRVLTPKGYAVITAHNAAEALEELRREEVDLVVTDIKMPGMDGLQLTEQLKARRPWMPVVIITGYGTQANEERAKAAGVSAFIHKPLTPDVIEDSAEFARHVEAVPVQEPAKAEVAVEPAVRESRIKNILLFVAAPFIGLVYAVLLPFVGLGMAGVMISKALGKNEGFQRFAASGLGTVLKIVFAPLIGLVYIVVLPFAGLVTLAYLGHEAWVLRRAQRAGV